MAHEHLRAMVGTLALAAGLGVAACGGDGPATPGEPRAATVSVFAGGGQSVAPGQDAPIPPAVIIRDGAGKPFAGATVQFSVTAGGGSLDGATSVSGSDGVARVGRWTVGIDGVQRLSATVGSLTPVTIEATIGAPSGTITRTVPPSGGTVEITAPGHPYDGLTLTVPAGAFSASEVWSLRIRTDLTLPQLPAGYQVGGALLEVTTDAPRSAVLMTLDVPVGPPAGKGLVVAFYDPARRIIEVLPTVAQTSASTRVVTTHLRADFLIGRALAGVMASANGGSSSTGVLVPITFSLPQPTAQAAFNPATDQWPVVDYSAADEPNGFSGIISLFQMVAPSTGTNLSTLVKPLATPGFYADAGAIGTLIEGNALMQPVEAHLAAMHAQIGPQATADAFTAQTVTAQIAMTGQPTMLAHYNASTGPVSADLHYTNPVSSSGSQMTLNTSLGSQSTLTRASVTFQPHHFDALYKPAPTITDRVLYTPGFIVPSNGVPALMQQLSTLNALSGDARAQKNDEIATRAGMLKPALELESTPGGGWYPPEPSGSQPVRGDNLNVRLAGGTEEFSIHDFDSGAKLSESFGPALGLDPYAGPTNGARRRMVLVKRKTDLSRRTKFPYAVTRVDIERARFKAAPDTARITSDSLTARFDAAVVPPPSGGFQITWDWGDGTSSTTQNSTMATHQYSTVGNYTVTVTLRSADGSVVLAEDTVYVRSDMSPHWRLTSMSNPGQLDLNVSIPIAVILRQTIASPSQAMIAVDEFAGLSNLTLRFNPNGPWTVLNCCVPVHLGGSVANELRKWLGSTPSQQVSAGANFDGYTLRTWSESTPDLGAGTMSGQYPEGNYTYDFRPPLPKEQPPIRQDGPEYVLRFTATRNGTAMSGVITFYYWAYEDAIPGEPQGFFDTHPTSFSFPFTAERIK